MPDGPPAPVTSTRGTVSGIGSDLLDAGGGRPASASLSRTTSSGST